MKTLALLLFAATPVVAAPVSAARPPATRVEVVRDTLHGDVIEDPYRWLEHKDAPETRAWVGEQMAFTKGLLDQVPGRDAVVQRLTQLYKADSRTSPAVRNGRYFFMARRADQQQQVLMLREGADGADTPLIDPVAMDPSLKTTVNIQAISDDGKLLVYGVRKGGEDEVEIRMYDVDARKDLPGGLPKARYFGVSLAPDKRTFYFSRYAPEGSRIWRSRVGEDVAQATMLFGEGLGPSEIPAAGLSEDGRWLLIQVYVGSSGDDVRVYAKNVAEDGPIVPIATDLKTQMSGEILGDMLFLLTRWQAPNGRVVAVDLRRPARELWKERVPERKDAVLDNLTIVGGKLFASYLRNVSSELRTFALDGKPLGDVKLPGIGAVRSFSGRNTGGEAFLEFNALNQPATIYRLDVATGRQRVWWKSSIPFASDRFEVKQVWYTSKDGTRVPMFVMQKKGQAYDGNAPVLLTGYGGFNVSETPDFSTFAAAWVEQGGIWANPNLRGGGEFGEAWHQAGMRARKQNTFDDFIAAGEWLIANKVTRTERLAIMGGSNGGLLVGAAMTQRPDLFGAVVCTVPLLDMLRFHQFLVARFWTPEYGSAENPEEYAWLKAYSPYQHVKPGVKYPATLFMTGDSDTRVDPLHARKMAALVQARTAGDAPILLHYDTAAGHAGGKPVSKTVEDSADLMMFLRWTLGMKASATP